MQYTLEIDETLMNAALECGFGDARSTLEEALKILIRREAYREAAGLFGKIPLEFDMDAMRAARRFK
jgi:hypothetical protein